MSISSSEVGREVTAPRRRQFGHRPPADRACDKDHKRYRPFIGELKEYISRKDLSADKADLRDLDLDTIKKYYVMEGQRSVHLEVVTGGNKAAKGRATPRAAQGDVTFF